MFTRKNPVIVGNIEAQCALKPNTPQAERAFYGRRRRGLDWGTPSLPAMNLLNTKRPRPFQIISQANGEDPSYLSSKSGVANCEGVINPIISPRGNSASLAPVASMQTSPVTMHKEIQVVSLFPSKSPSVSLLSRLWRHLPVTYVISR